MRRRTSELTPGVAMRLGRHGTNRSGARAAGLCFLLAATALLLSAIAIRRGSGRNTIAGVRRGYVSPTYVEVHSSLAKAGGDQDVAEFLAIACGQPASVARASPFDVDATPKAVKGSALAAAAHSTRAPPSHPSRTYTNFVCILGSSNIHNTSDRCLVRDGYF